MKKIKCKFWCNTNEQIQFNNADSNILVDGRKLNPVFRKEWNPYKPTEIRGENYVDYGVFYGRKYMSDSEKDEIIAKQKDKSDEIIKSWGRNPKYANNFIITKCSEVIN